MTEEQIEEIKKFYKPPFRYDNYGQMIWCVDNNRAVDIRGWGNIKHVKDAPQIQDNFGQLIADMLNERLGKQPIIRDSVDPRLKGIPDEVLIKYLRGEITDDELEAYKEQPKQEGE